MMSKRTLSHCFRQILTFIPADLIECIQINKESSL